MQQTILPVEGVSHSEDGPSSTMPVMSCSCCRLQVYFYQACKLGQLSHGKACSALVSGDELGLCTDAMIVSLQADEELLLLEAVDMFGLGNWQAVANHIGSKSPMACHSHYMRIWVESPSFPSPHVLPQMVNIDPLQVGGACAASC